MLTVYLGGIQFGIIISNWNVAFKPFAWINGYTYDTSDSNSYMHNTVV